MSDFENMKMGVPLVRQSELAKSMTHEQLQQMGIDLQSRQDDVNKQVMVTVNGQDYQVNVL